MMAGMSGNLSPMALERDSAREAPDRPAFGRAIDDDGPHDDYPRVHPADQHHSTLAWIGKALAHGIAGIRHWRSLWMLWKAPPGSSLRALLQARPEIWGMLRAPFIAADWKVEARFRHIMDHCRIVTAIGRPMDLRPNEFAVLTDLRELGSEFRVTIDQPRWMLRDGLLALSLWQGNDRLYSLAFTMAQAGNRLVAYVGGVQGRRGPDLRDRYRAFTKAAHGMRPRDLLIDLFRLVCEQLGVARIYGVSDANRHQRSRYFTHRTGFIDPVRIDYDEMWRDRGARNARNGFLELPVRVSMRNPASMPPRKRAQYRRRYAMFASVRERLVQALANPRAIPIHEHEPIWL